MTFLQNCLSWQKFKEAGIIKKMIVREVLPKEKEKYNQVVNHPLQAWEWGEFREKEGKRVIRLGVFEKDQIKSGYQLTVHPIPQTSYSVLYFPRGPKPDRTMLDALKKMGREEKAIFIKMAPNVFWPVANKANVEVKELEKILAKNQAQPVKPFWFEYSYLIDLKQSEESLLAAMHSKTRYNLRLAERHRVKIKHDNSSQAFETYLKMMFETTKRQGFFAHTPDYHRRLWQVFNPAGMADLLLAKYRGKTLAAWMFFNFKNVLYYPYGGSSREHKKVMPAYKLMWEAIKLGQKKKCETFNLWGCLGPDPNPQDPWFGFHRFKSGFNGQMIKYLGSFDLIIDNRYYPFYQIADQIRGQILKLKAKLPF